MKRELPIYNIEGTDFEVDVVNLRLHEKANPDNIISVSDMRDVENGYAFDYSLREKNIPMISTDYKDIRSVKIPELVKLDPVGMAEKYGHPVDSLQGKTDFDLMVNHEALARRLSGHLPTIDIAGHTFFVDLRMDMLRPKDDFLSEGIPFSEIQHYYNDDLDAYVIPYNPKKHEFQELSEDMVTIPKDIIIISFPPEFKLDPVGFNRLGGWDEKNELKERGIQSNFEAKVMSWSESGFEETIRENKKAKKSQQLEKNTESPKVGKGQRKGRKL